MFYGLIFFLKLFFSFKIVSSLIGLVSLVDLFFGLSKKFRVETDVRTCHDSNDRKFVFGDRSSFNFFILNFLLNTNTVLERRFRFLTMVLFNFYFLIGFERRFMVGSYPTLAHENWCRGFKVERLS